MLVQHNSFLNGPYTAVAIQSGGYDNAFLNATENYWGTTQEGAISKMIRDSNDSVEIEAEIDFSDWLTSPHPKTPRALRFK